MRARPRDPAPHRRSRPPRSEGCDERCWGYQVCNLGFTHPSYEGWNHTRVEPPPCAKGSNGNPDGCCHTTVYNEIVDQVAVPRLPAGDYVVRWRWDAEQSPQCGGA